MVIIDSLKSAESCGFQAFWLPVPRSICRVFRAGFSS